jgi:hypothetical protein
VPHYWLDFVVVEGIGTTTSMSYMLYIYDYIYILGNKNHFFSDYYGKNRTVTFSFFGQIRFFFFKPEKWSNQKKIAGLPVAKPFFFFDILLNKKP